VKYSGTLSIHYEQGCGSWAQFHDYRGLHGDKNQFYNWDFTINFGKNENLKNIKIFDNDDKIIYDGAWTFSRINTSNNNYFTSPEEIPAEEWREICSNDYKCEIEADFIIKGLEEKK